MEVKAIKTEIFRENQDLMAFLIQHLPKTLPEKSVIAVTSKIVALAEGRVVVAETNEEREKIIKAESDWAIKTKYTWITLKDGMVMASAGIDRSNAEGGKTILLPKDSFDSAERIREFLMKHYNLKELGVLLTDSRIFPLRNGVVGVALGYAGFRGFRDERGMKDIFGRTMELTKIDVADSLATAAVFEMGEGSEQQPLAVITHSRTEFTDKVDRDELKIDIKEDLYQPMFEAAKDIEL